MANIARCEQLKIFKVLFGQFSSSCMKGFYLVTNVKIGNRKFEIGIGAPSVIII